MPARIERTSRTSKGQESVYTTAGDSCGLIGEELLRELGIVSEKQLAAVMEYCHELNTEGYDGFKTEVSVVDNQVVTKWNLSDKDVYLIAMMFGTSELAFWNRVKDETKDNVAFERTYFVPDKDGAEKRKIRVKLNLNDLEAAKLHDKWNMERLLGGLVK